MHKQKYQGMKTDGRGCEEGLRKKKQEVQSASDDGKGTEGWIKSKQGSERGATQMIEKHEESEGWKQIPEEEKEKVHRRASKEACNTVQRFLERKSGVKDEDT